MSSLYNMKTRCALNGVGLYSKEQVEELEKRGDDLWKELNHVHAGLQTYVYALEVEMRKGPVDKSNALVENAIQKLKEITESANDALFSDC